MKFAVQQLGAFLVIFLGAVSSYSQVNVYDGFEAPGLGKIWATDRMVDSSFTIQSQIVRKGSSAARITLRNGDVVEAGIGKSKDSERDELREANNLISIEGRVYEYQFSLFLPDSFPIVPVRLVIAQWKQNCGSNNQCSDDSPVLAIRYVGGKLYITMQTDSGQVTLYKTTEEIRNKWLDFKFRVKFSRLANGQIDAWLNGDSIIHYAGISCYSSARGYPAKSYFYFKMGLYRDRMPQPMTIYIDEYSKKELTEE